VLHELRVEDLLLIERAELRLAGGLNVLTGETGAGKTVLAHALDLLLGGRTRGGIVRPGAREAWVEGVFERPGQLPPELAERLPEGEELVLARRVGAEGGTRAYIGGRSATVGELRAVAEGLLAFYGQHEHRRLTVASAQLEILDASLGRDGARARRAVAEAHGQASELRRRAAELAGLAGARERELDLLDFELGEIEAADPRASEDEELGAERGRLRHVEALREASAGAASALAPEGDGPGASELLGAAVRALEGVAGVDAELDAQADRVRGALLELDDVAGELRDHGAGLESSPARLAELEERVALLERLKRKHGGSLDAVLAHAEVGRERRAQLRDDTGAAERIDEELAGAEAQLTAAADRLGVLRRRGAPRLAERVRAELGELAMEGAGFEVALTPREAGPTGAEAVELLLAANPGVPAGPLRDIASGGELSRAMLALLSVGGAGDRRTLVFDEVDAGIGGRTARVVGERLRALARDRQLICITHLPQVAALGERHFVVAKDSAVTPARARVDELAGGEVVGELARMLGAGSDDLAARRHAQELLRAA